MDGVVSPKPRETSFEMLKKTTEELWKSEIKMKEMRAQIEELKGKT